MFTHKHPAFDGIDKLYADKILPQLLPYERERKKVWKHFKITAAIIIIIASAAAIILYMKTHHIFAPIFSAVAGFGVAMSFYHVKSRGVKQATKSILMGEIITHIGLRFNEKLDHGDVFMHKLQGLSLLPKIVHRHHFEDHIFGQLGDVGVNICESKLERKIKTDKGERWVNVFQGSFINIDFHRDFLGTTIVLRDRGVFNSKRKGEMKKIGLASPRFEKIFEAYGTDQVESRYLLTPTFMERLMELEDSVDGKKLRFAFSEQSLWIVVEHPNRFEIKSLREPMTDFKRIQTVIEEIESVLSIVSAVSVRDRKRYS